LLFVQVSVPLTVLGDVGSWQILLQKSLMTRP